MIKFECRKCHGNEFFINEKGGQKGLYCADCGAWQKWLNKSELNAYMNALNQQTTQKVDTNFDRITQSPESLVAFAYDYRTGVGCTYCNLPSRSCNYRCKAGLLGWLKQKAGESNKNK